MSIQKTPTVIEKDPDSAKIIAILEGALESAHAEKAVTQNLYLHGGILHAGNHAFPIDKYERTIVIGAGKAGAQMASACAGVLRDKISTGLVIVKDGHAFSNRCGPVQILQAAHPLPDERGIVATTRLIKLLENTTQNDLVIVLISGGGSALMTAPAPGISLLDLQHLTSQLLACGAGIEEINILRKHLDQIKGGQLARLASPAQVLSLIISDVIGDKIDAIASGPTVADPSTYEDAMAILDRYHLSGKIPAAIQRHLEAGLAGLIPETPKPNDPIFTQVVNVVIANNRKSIQAAKIIAGKSGYNTLLLTTYLQGEARQAGRWFAALARQVYESGEPIPLPACLLAGGETVVNLRGSGIGGRNQELALGAVHDMAGLPNALLVTLATDGGDGCSRAAGAAVNGETLGRGQALGMQPMDYLTRNDSASYFEWLGDQLITGPTQTNVNDLVFLFLR